MGQKFGKDLAGQLWLGIFHVVTVKHQLGLQSSEESAGQDVQNDPLAWLAANASCCLGAQLGLLTSASTGGPSNMVVSGESDFLDGDWLLSMQPSQENQEKLHGLFFLFPFFKIFIGV